MINLNSSVRLICAFLYSIFISFNQIELIYLLPIVFMVFCEYKVIFLVVKKLLFLNVFIGMIFIILLLQGDTKEALNIYFRTNMIIFFNLLLFFRSNGYDIVRAMNELRFSKKVVSSTYFTLKMIQSLSDEIKRVRQTLKARGFKAASNLFSYETFGNIFGHIFILSIKKANQMQDSFKLRGFHGRIYLIQNSKLSFYDVILIFLVCMLFVKKVIV
ncbi:MAG: energy-coupling factor transporter transmembrane component T [Halarcobacter sp.]